MDIANTTYGAHQNCKNINVILMLGGEGSKTMTLGIIVKGRKFNMNFDGFF